jgi:hypothetical protein
MSRERKEERIRGDKNKQHDENTRCLMIEQPEL